MSIFYCKENEELFVIYYYLKINIILTFIQTFSLNHIIDVNVTDPKMENHMFSLIRNVATTSCNNGLAATSHLPDTV